MNEQQLEEYLTTTLYRVDCPSAVTLHQYHHTELSNDAQKQIETHVERCVHCQVDLAELAAASATEKRNTLFDEAKRQLAQAKQMVATLLSGGDSPSGQVGQVAYVRRGVASTQTAAYQVGEKGMLTLDIKPLDEKGDDVLFAMFGTLRLLAPSADLSNLQIKLFSVDSPEQSWETTCNANGRFTLKPCPSGMYHLRFSDPNDPNSTDVIVPFVSIRT